MLNLSYLIKKDSPITTKWKTNISIEPQVAIVTIGFDIGPDLDLSRYDIWFTISQDKVIRLPRNKK